MEKAKRKWVRIIMYVHILSLLCTCLNETKGGETSKLKRGNIRITNMHKKHRRQGRDPGSLDQIAKLRALPEFPDVRMAHAQ